MEIMASPMARKPICRTFRSDAILVAEPRPGRSCNRSRIFKVIMACAARGRGAQCRSAARKPQGVDISKPFKPVPPMEGALQRKTRGYKISHSATMAAPGLDNNSFQVSLQTGRAADCFRLFKGAKIASYRFQFRRHTLSCLGELSVGFESIHVSDFGFGSCTDGALTRTF